MDSENQDCDHIIRIANFKNFETVSYPIIKIVGLIQQKHGVCENANETITLSTNNNGVPNLIAAFDNKFKILAKLREGKNVLLLKFCRTQIELNIEYLPRRSNFSVIPLYVICDGHDGYFQSPQEGTNDPESACKRITLGSQLLQCVTAEKLWENNLGRKTFCLEEDCKVFCSKLNYLEARKMDQESLWQNIAREIMSSQLGSETKKYLAFLSCTDYRGDKYTEETKTHEDLISITEGYVALGGGGLALFGTGCLYTWPEHFTEILQKFGDNTSVDRTRFLDDSCYRSTLGACFSTTLGSVLHELYHTFNLGHTEKGIMGRGFDNIYKFFNANFNQINKNISKPFQSQIEFKEEFEAEKLSERLQKENQRKEFCVISKPEEADDTVLMKSCAVILGYHKWFNDVKQQSYTLTYDVSNKFIKSTAGIRAIEIRRKTDELVIFDWTFEGKVIRYSFQLPKQVFLDKNDVLLFVEDTNGNIFKENIVVSRLEAQNNLD